ncbi:ADP-ribosylation/crystallin J1 [Taibaiella soli]|uniref:ADP-ribosylation/crystallin J1 n=1 Tax=Taibaiella soli TaxID=1649169 RepID=A0A2W2A8Q4_9BACT|nr:ADP-ribosylation/crystallin J1 [Taibaiella soli]PZF71651.1 ADP-ribosylation/crystallin J1 [Taibaiella soli]
MNTVTLYRPVGLKELELIAESGFQKYPPRLEWQPIFYPVLNKAYACQIAQEWNTEDAFSGYCGIVTKFELNAAHYAVYEVQNVGNEMHNEFWVPAEALETFNENIVGKIEIVAAFFGANFETPDNLLIADNLKHFQK